MQIKYKCVPSKGCTRELKCVDSLENLVLKHLNWTATSTEVERVPSCGVQCFFFFLKANLWSMFFPISAIFSLKVVLNFYIKKEEGRVSYNNSQLCGRKELGRERGDPGRICWRKPRLLYQTRTGVICKRGMNHFRVFILPVLWSYERIFYSVEPISKM